MSIDDYTGVVGGGDWVGSAAIDSSFRYAFHELNEGIRALAKVRKCLLADLHVLFEGHDERSDEPWLTETIEPNFAGATAIAREWRRLFGRPQ